MKKFVAWLLVCLMVVSSLPLSAFAADEHDHTAAITEETEAKCPGADNEHNLSNSTATKLETVDPVCDNRGYSVYKCDTCKVQFLADFVEATGEDHQWEDKEGKAPNCTDPGYTAYKQCTKCGDIEGKTTLEPTAEAHTWATKYEGACGTEGGRIQVTYCSACQVEDKREVVAGTTEGHIWGTTPVINTDPVCGVEGEATYTCQYCDGTKTVVIKPVIHNMVENKAKPATCTEDGWILHWTCSICNKYFVKDGEDFVVTTADAVKEEATDHDWDYTVKENPEAPGTDIKVWFCKNGCGETKPSETTDHVYGEILTTNATCANGGSTGEKYQLCVGCGKKNVVETLPVPAHDWEEKQVITAPSCGTAGSTLYECSVCGATETRETDETDEGHVYTVVKETYQELTCTQDGRYLMQCANCDSTKEVTKTHEGHKAVDQILSPAKCSATGLKNVVCSVCDEVLEENVVLPKLPHTYATADGGTTNDKTQAVWIVVEPTCTTIGYKYRLCTVCSLMEDYIQTEDSTGHDLWEKSDESTRTLVPATCTTDGEATWICSCGEKLTEVLEQTGHSTDKVITVDAVCNQYAYEIYYCENENCPLAIVDRMNVDGKNYNIVDAEGKATSLKVIEIVADVEGGFATGDEAHDYKKETLNAPTCETAGSESWICQRCAHYEIHAIDKLAHSTEDEKNIIAAEAPTCTEDGNIAYLICDDCGCFYVETAGEGETVIQTVKTAEEIIDPKTGHTYEFKEASAATCYADGKVAHYTCANEGCDLMFANVEGDDKPTINATVDTNRPAHAWGELIAEVPATCITMTDGVKAHYECGNEGCTAVSLDGETEMGEGETLVITAAHDYGDLISGTSATCTDNATIDHYICSVCATIFDADKKAIESYVNADSATGHAPKLVEAQGATCKADGRIEHYTCDNHCGKYFSDAEATAELTLAQITVKYTNTKVDYTSVDAAKEAGHGNLTFKDGPFEATCVLPQFTQYTCDDCGLTILIVDKTAALGHQYSNDERDDGETTKGAPEELIKTSCGGTYIESYICKDCNETVALRYIADSAAKHTPGESQAADKTCTTNGSGEYFLCKDCGAPCDKDGKALSADDVAALVIPMSHNLGDEVKAVTKTCTTDGNIAHWICKDCGKYFTDAAATNEIAAEDVKLVHIGHVLTAVSYKAPTCTEVGNIAHQTCANCDLIFDANGDVYEGAIELAKTAHTLYFVDKVDPTCVNTRFVKGEGNIAHYRCEDCGACFADEKGEKELNYETEVVIAPLTTHTPNLFFSMGYPATCTEDGMEDYYMCSICGRYRANVYVDAKGNVLTEEDLAKLVIPAAHSKVAVDEVPATCDGTGTTAGYRCTECDWTDVETISATGKHNPVLVDSITNATCGGFNYKHYDCLTCGRSMDEDGNLIEYIDEFERKPAHNYVETTEHEQYKAPLCGVAGVGVKVCSGCKDVQTYEIKALDHINIWDAVITESCLDEEDTYRLCVNCEQYIEKKHNLTTTTVPATCIDFGYTMTYCVDCGVLEGDVVYTDAKGDHSYVINYAPEATFISAGTKITTCANCDYEATETYTKTGVQYTLSYENANGGTIINDSALIKVTISAQSYVGVKACMLNLDMTYDSSVVTFDQQMTDASNKGYAFSYNGSNANENDDGSYVTVMVTGMSNGAPADMTIGMTAVPVVDLYFRVNNATALYTAFNLISMETTSKNTADVADDSIGTTVQISKFMDATGDGVIDNADILVTYDLLQNETYDARVDIDKDGVITSWDIGYMYQFMLEQKSYDEMTALGQAD